jgi:dolichol kinase
MFLSFSVAFSGMIMAEVIRFFKLYPLGEIIHKFMTTFIDQKDTGTAILSHIYLLIGCALPVWLNR